MPPQTKGIANVNADPNFRPTNADILASNLQISQNVEKLTKALITALPLIDGQSAQLGAPVGPRTLQQQEPYIWRSGVINFSTTPFRLFLPDRPLALHVAMFARDDPAPIPLIFAIGTGADLSIAAGTAFPNRQVLTAQVSSTNQPIFSFGKKGVLISPINPLFAIAGAALSLQVTLGFSEAQV